MYPCRLRFCRTVWVCCSLCGILHRVTTLIASRNPGPVMVGQATTMRLDPGRERRIEIAVEPKLAEREIRTRARGAQGSSVTGDAAHRLERCTTSGTR